MLSKRRGRYFIGASGAAILPRAATEGDAAIPEELKAAALGQLGRLPDGEALCHGDFQPNNVLLCARGPVVIDWVHATRGAAAGAFARTSLMMRMGALPPGARALIRHGRRLGGGLFRRAHLRGYGERRRHDPGEVLRWELVRTVERFADRIPEERPGLLREAELLRGALRPAQ